MSQPPPDIGHLLTARAGEEMALNEAHLNPKLGRIVSTLGVYRQWVHGGVTLLSGVLAEQLLARAPDSVAAMVPANSGTESVEAAIKIARAATGRPRILYAEHA
ncbi:MAG TPA: hypothetical protein VFW38_02265, partial [Solirubrobacteraceae bacterium]|nr:hypothetical protein [Solirubrobacteraceae bacterium]